VKKSVNNCLVHFVTWSSGLGLVLLLNGCFSDENAASLRLRPNQVVVKPGDTLYAIATRHHVSPQRLAQTNLLTSRVVHPGEVLLLPPRLDRQQLARETEAAPFVQGKGLFASTVHREAHRTTPAVPTARTIQSVVSPKTAGFLWPVKGNVLTAFGREKGARSAGISISAPLGAVVMAPASGTVLHVGEQPLLKDDYGLFLILQHDSGAVTLCGHLSRCFLSKGAHVKRGQVIGAVGSTGLKGKTPRLYFELRLKSSKTANPRPVNPLPHLAG
jgi:murein DD-endopeptidase MepM/ murein hydrolase activator NlpD